MFRKHSRISDEKEVSHGYEEVEEEEDVEVNLASASPSYWGCASASSFREHSGLDLKTWPLLFL